MTDNTEIKTELIEQYSKSTQKNKTPLDKYEAVIIIVALVTMTAALISGKLAEEAYSALMGAFLGYTFGRIFNGWQGKE